MLSVFVRHDLRYLEGLRVVLCEVGNVSKYPMDGAGDIPLSL